jgi:hypothetical protein
MVALFGWIDERQSENILNTEGTPRPTSSSSAAASLVRSVPIYSQMQA